MSVSLIMEAKPVARVRATQQQRKRQKMNNGFIGRYWILASAVLATGGTSAGVYHFMQQDYGPTDSSVLHLEDPQTLRAEDTNVSVADATPTAVDAVADAWMQQNQNQNQTPVEVETGGVSSYVPTQLNEAQQSEVVQEPTPVPTDAQALVGLVPVAEAEAEPDLAASNTVGGRYANHSAPDEVMSSPLRGDVTLGQEPENQAELEDDWLDPEDSQPAEVLAQERARSAFGQQQAGGGRYNSAPNTANPGEAGGAYDNSFARSPAAATTIEESPPVASPTAPTPGSGRYAGDPFANTGTPSPAQPKFDGQPERFAALDRGNELRAPSGNQSPQQFNIQPLGSTSSLEASPPSSEGTGRPGESALEGPQKPALVIQKTAPPEIQVGKPAKFRVQVRNIGSRPADDVVVREQIPMGTRFLSASPSAETAGGELIWQLGTLSVGEQRELEVELMPTTEGEIGSVVTVTHSTQASVKTICTEPQLALRLTAPRKVMMGTEQRLKIELHNPGSGDATGVMLLENVPEELRHQAGPALEFEVGTLKAGETREMELVLTAEKPGQVINRISARGDGNLQVEQEIEFEVIAPDLKVEVQGPRVRYLERPATYTVKVANPGTAAARNIELVTRLPKGMRFVRANNLGEYDSASHAVYWSLAELPEGEEGDVEVVALPIQSGEQEIKVQSSAAQGLEDETSQQILVEGLAAINFEVVDLQDPIEVGGETTYEIRVVNQGTKSASDVQLAATVPPGMKIIEASGETKHAIQAGAVLFQPLSQLAPKADAIYRIQVQGVRSGDQRLIVEVDTEDFGQPIRKEESTRVFGNE